MMPGWDLSCRDWESRIASGASIIPDLPLFHEEAELGLAFFDELTLPDTLPDDEGKKLTMRDGAGEWFRDLVRTIFGSWDPASQTRMIRDFFLMVQKGSSKTTYSAGLLLAVMMMNKRHNSEALFVGPTQAISERAYEQAVNMIADSKDLQRRFKPRDHKKTIDDLYNGSALRVQTFDANILTGSKLIFALVDEIHLLGRNAHAIRVLRQIRGGLNKTPEGALLMITTQSDEAPSGVFRDELKLARRVRDGRIKGEEGRPMLPVLFEFPHAIAADRDSWSDPDNWPMVMPNLGRSVHMRDLVQDWRSENEKGEHAVRVWASQYLNIEIGIGLKDDAWAGAEFWEKGADVSVTRESILESCDVVVIGIDGGGLDDLFGLTLAGRHAETRDWLTWSHAWCHESVLERRQSIAARLRDFETDGDLTIVSDDLGDIEDIVGIVEDVQGRGLLGLVAVDPAGLIEFIEALAEIGVTQDDGLVIGVPQGYGMMNAIKGTERRLANGTLRHAPSRMMDWCVGNLKIEPTATAIRATKQNAGDAKIDPVMALFDAVFGLARNPEAGGSVYTAERGLLFA